jgi:uncharacterized protein YmfQ (DUF2313 family)
MTQMAELASSKWQWAIAVTIPFTAWHTVVSSKDEYLQPLRVGLGQEELVEALLRVEVPGQRVDVPR